MKTRIIFPYKGTPFVITSSVQSDHIKDHLPCVILYYYKAHEEGDIGYFSSIHQNYGTLNQDDYLSICNTIDFDTDFEELIK